MYIFIIISTQYLNRWRMLDEYPHEEFTEVMWVQFEHIDNARYYLFHFHVCFAQCAGNFFMVCTVLA